MARPATELERHLAAVWAAARQRWPSIDIDQAAFFAYAAPHCPSDHALERWCSEELYLTCALNSSDPSALAVFDATYVGTLDRALARFSDAALVDDAKQVLRERLLVRGDHGEPPRIATFTGRGPLAKWLEVAALRIAVSLRRRERDVPFEDRALGELQGTTADPQLVHLKQTYLGEFTTAWRRALRELEPRDRTLLRLHVLDRLSVERLGVLYGVHATTAARWLRQVREQLADRVRSVMQAMLVVTPQELDSILSLIHSQMDVTLSELLSEDAGLQNTSSEPR